MKKILFSIIILCLFSINIIYSQSTCDVGDYNNSPDLFEGSVFAKAPINFAYKHSCTQQIYTKEELSEISGKQITKIQFRCKPEDILSYDYDCTIKVYMVETELNEFKKNEDERFIWVPVTAENLVYEKQTIIDFATPAIYETDIDMEFDLKQPFQYTGENLMVMVVKESDQYLDNIFTDFYCFPKNVLDKPYRTLYDCNDNQPFDNSFPQKSTTALKQIAVALFTYTEPSSVKESALTFDLQIKDRNVTIESADLEKVRLYDLTGKLIESRSAITSGYFSFDIDSKGVYIIEIEYKNGKTDKQKITIL